MLPPLRHHYTASTSEAVPPQEPIGVVQTASTVMSNILQGAAVVASGAILLPGAIALSVADAALDMLEDTDSLALLIEVNLVALLIFKIRP